MRAAEGGRLWASVVSGTPKRTDDTSCWGGASLSVTENDKVPEHTGKGVREGQDSRGWGGHDSRREHQGDSASRRRSQLGSQMGTGRAEGPLVPSPPVGYLEGPARHPGPSTASRCHLLRPGSSFSSSCGQLAGPRGTPHGVARAAVFRSTSLPHLLPCRASSFWKLPPPASEPPQHLSRVPGLSWEGSACLTCPTPGPRRLGLWTLLSS